MRMYTTCGGCGDYVLCLGINNPTHAGCDPAETYLQRLEREFLAAAKADDDETVTKLERLIEQITTAPPRLPEAALIYADWGWPVFPLKPGSKHPATRHGFKDATTDKSIIRTWWQQTPTANIGLPTGLSFDVLDVDFKHGAVKVWPDLRDSDAMLATHGQAITPSGGLHIFLLPTGGGNAAGMGHLPGLDYRGVGGYVVAPPSTTPDGRYMWCVKPSPMVKAGEAVAA